MFFARIHHLEIIATSVFALLAFVSLPTQAAQPVTPKLAAQSISPKPTYGELLKSSAPTDWRPLDDNNTIYMELASGRVVMELAPEFAPLHAANIKALRLAVSSITA